MARYMLNTDTCSYVMKRSNDAVLTRLQDVPVSDVVHATSAAAADTASAKAGVR